MYNKTIVINPVNNQAESVQRDNAFGNHVTYVRGGSRFALNRPFFETLLSKVKPLVRSI